MDQIFGIGKYKNKINLTKIGGSKMGGSFPNGALKNSNFLTFYAGHMKFLGLANTKQK